MVKQTEIKVKQVSETKLLRILNCMSSFISFSEQDASCSRGCLACFGRGVHCGKCDIGFYKYRDGSYSQCKECPPGCTECYGILAIYCADCTMPNRYGRDCKKICSKGCLNSSCKKNTGECVCRDNY